MFDGDWESGNLDKLMPGKVGFFLMPTLKAGGAAHRDVRSADLRHRGEGQACRLCGVLLQLGGDQPGGAQGQRRRRWVEPWGPAEPAGAGAEDRDR